MKGRTGSWSHKDSSNVLSPVYHLPTRDDERAALLGKQGCEPGTKPAYFARARFQSHADGGCSILQADNEGDTTARQNLDLRPNFHLINLTVRYYGTSYHPVAAKSMRRCKESVCGGVAHKN